jgi:micrococcal nuclease
MWMEWVVLTGKQKGLFLGVFLWGILMGRWIGQPMFWNRYTNVMDISPNHFGPDAKPLVGRAVSVSDGDTIRFLHTPTPFHSPSVNKDKKEKVSTVALPIRVCSIDTPETAKFGKSGQPFGQAAKDKMKELVVGDGSVVVQVRLLQKDQYGRAVAQLFTTPPAPKRIVSLLFGGRRNKHVDEEMLKAGLAEVYVGSGAVYGPKGKDAYLAMEDEARKKKLGIWSQTKRESAAEYKKRTKS